MLKVMRGSIQIKIGGGYQPIDEFLPQALPVELEKLERKDPLQKITGNNTGNVSVNDSKSIGKSGTLARLPSKASNAASPVKRRGN